MFLYRKIWRGMTWGQNLNGCWPSKRRMYQSIKIVLSQKYIWNISFHILDWYHFTPSYDGHLP